MPQHEWVQFVIGHGEFAASLERFRLRQPQPCLCGGVETAVHLLEECDAFQGQRQHWQIDNIERVLDTQDGLWRLQQFAVEVLPILARRHNTEGAAVVTAPDVLPDENDWPELDG